MLSAGADPRRRRALAGLAVAALVLHGLLIGSLGPGLAPLPDKPGGATPIQVRTLVAPVLAVAEPPPPAPVAIAPTPRPPPPPRPAVVVPPEVVPEPGYVRGPPSEPVLNPEPLVSANPDSLPLPVEAERAASAPVAAAEQAVAPASPASAAGALADAAPPPLYSTRLPPPMTLRYELRRGRLSGSGELLWRPEASGYSLKLEGSVVGLNVLTQLSEGALGPDGLAPLRFTDQRARRAAVAANFEREAGRIRFSGPSHEVPWQRGVQDRLSWMVQLAAVAAAEPARLAAGERIVLQVVGARGDSSLWAFRSEGPETLTLFSDRIETVRLLREPRSAYDTRVEVWLDPARHHLPVRATLGSGDEDRLELRLREMLP
ncbi:MAG: DUF3108 domain-containing protein [Piscinibacter sp.]